MHLMQILKWLKKPIILQKAHEGQYRKSGEPYFIHPLAVANILIEMELDIETITAGLLHDVVEDTEYTYEDIKRIWQRSSGFG